MSCQKLSDKELENKFLDLQDAIKERGDLPENIDKVLLLRFLKFYNGDVQKALRRLITSMELRSNYPNIFYNRDTLNPQLRKLIDQVEMVPLPHVTPDNHRVLTLRLIDFDPKNLIFDNALRVFTMVYDAAMITPDADRLADGEIVVFDLKGLTASHLARIGLSSLRCFIKYMMDAHPLRIKAVHVVNSHSLLDKLMMLLRPFLGAKAMKVIHFHLPNTTTLFDFVPREVLPEEFGGIIGPIEKSKWFWINRTDDNRDYILDDDRWKIKSKLSNEEEPPIDETLKYLGLC